MNFRYPLPQQLSLQAASLEEYASGAVQCHAELREGFVHSGLLVSNASAIVAMRGETELPFTVDSIVRLFQTTEDKSPFQRGDWGYFDNWQIDDDSSEQRMNSQPVRKLAATWAPLFLVKPETGMGFHTGDVQLKDGRTFVDVIFSSGYVSKVRGHTDLPFAAEEIAAIEITGHQWEWAE